MNNQGKTCFRVFTVSLKDMLVFSYIKRKTIEQKVYNNQNFCQTFRTGVNYSLLSSLSAAHLN